MKKILNKIFSNYDISFIFKLFNDYQNKLFIVGGVIRDSLLNGFDLSYDIDFSINESIEKVYEYLLQQQKNLSFQDIKIEDYILNYGVIRIVLHSKKYDITMFRSEKYVNNSRYPIVAYTKDINIDCLRRDFTVNSLYLGFDRVLYDPSGLGIKDIKRKKIRFITNDLDLYSGILRRITDDPLRIIRYIRIYLKFFPEQKLNFLKMNNLKTKIDIINFCSDFFKKITQYDIDTINILLQNINLLKSIGINKLISEISKVT